MLSNRNLHDAQHRPVRQANRVQSQSEVPGLLHADTDGSTPTTGNPGREYVGEVRPPSSPSLETVILLGDF